MLSIQEKKIGLAWLTARSRWRVVVVVVDNDSGLRSESRIDRIRVLGRGTAALIGVIEAKTYSKLILAESLLKILEIRPQSYINIMAPHF